jgi:lipopolysaccharide transport system permease protein
VFLLMLAITNFGIGLILSVLHCAHRDLVFLTQFLIQTGLLCTPVWFPLQRFSFRTQTLIALNPMAGLVEGFRWAVIGGDSPSRTMLLVSGSVSLTLLIVGLFYFRSQQDTLADIV